MKKPINILGRIIFGIDLTKPSSWRDRAVNYDQWHDWDAAERKRLGFFAGLKFWGKTNVPGSRVLLSRHWPHRLCWDWSIWVGLHRGAKWDGPRKLLLNISRKYRTVSFECIFVKAHIHWQDYSHMAGLGPIGAGCPDIIWAHHLEHAEPMGSA